MDNNNNRQTKINIISIGTFSVLSLSAMLYV